MKITTYNLELDDNRLPILIKENSRNYTEVDDLRNPANIVKTFVDMFHANRLAEEHMWVVGLNNRCKPTGIFEISHGTVGFTVVNGREIFIRLLLSGAASFIMLHNHTTDNTSPSTDDINITAKCKASGEFLGIKLLDHIIISEDSYYSFAENGNIISL